MLLPSPFISFPFRRHHDRHRPGQLFNHRVWNVIVLQLWFKSHKSFVIVIIQSPLFSSHHNHLIFNVSVKKTDRNNICRGSDFIHSRTDHPIFIRCCSILLPSRLYCRFRNHPGSAASTGFKIYSEIPHHTGCGLYRRLGIAPSLEELTVVWLLPVKVYAASAELQALSPYTYAQYSAIHLCSVFCLHKVSRIISPGRPNLCWSHCNLQVSADISCHEDHCADAGAWRCSSEPYAPLRHALSESVSD